MNKLTLYRVRYKDLADIMVIAATSMQMTEVRHHTVVEAYSNYCEDKSIPYTEDGLAEAEESSMIEKIGNLVDVNPMWEEVEDYDIVSLHKKQNWYK